MTIRSITVERGHDPRDFSLVAFGGAGPLHAAELAEALGIGEVIVPPHPGITSAAGLLTSDLRYDHMRTVFAVEGSIDADAIEAGFADLAATLVARLERDGADAAAVVTERFLDCRYVGQGYELRVAVPDGRVTESTLAAFHSAHRDEYGHAFDDPVEIVNLRVTVRGQRPKLERVAVAATTSADADGSTHSASWRLDGELIELPTPFRDRESLAVGEPVVGPIVLLQRDTTVVVPPGWVATATAEGVVLLTKANERTR